MKQSWFLVALLLSAFPASPQTTNQRPPRKVYSSVTFGFGPAGTMTSSKQGAPFSAVLNEQMEQTLNDGTNINRDNQEVVMRDGMGRIYRARKIKRHENENDQWVIITLTDPVRHVQYFCTPIRKVCTKMQYRQPRILTRPHSPGPSKSRDVTVEELGASNICGVEVEGKRITRVIPEGAIGNDRPFTASEELWHSEELDVEVQVKRTDPRMGTRTTTMTEVSLAEPDPKYFQVPEGYRVEERKIARTALAPLPSAPMPAFPPMPPHQ